MTEPKRWPTQVCTCGQVFIMAISSKGGDIPVDPDPHPEGTISLRDYGVARPTATVLTVTQRFGRTNLHRTHFATCKDAAKHRRANGRKYGS